MIPSPARLSVVMRENGKRHYQPKPTASENKIEPLIAELCKSLNLTYKSNKAFVGTHYGFLYPDFRLEPCRLVIEIDGSVHWSKSADRDCKRDFWIEDRGYRVLHIPNEDVLMSKEELLQRIRTVYRTFPYPDQKMNSDYRLWRHPVYQGSGKVKEKKLSKAQIAHAKMQQESWKKWQQRASDPIAK